MTSTKHHLVKPALVGLATVGILSIALHWLRLADAESNDAEQTAHSAIEKRIVNGETHLIIESSFITASGIRLASVTSETYQEAIDAIATVVLPQTITEQQHVYQSARADLLRATLAVKAAHLDVGRLRPLQHDGRIVSDKTLETAENTLAIEEANLKIAMTQLDAQTALLRQQWGSTLAELIMNKAGGLEPFVTGQKLLMQITLPVGRYVENISAVTLAVAAGTSLSVHNLSTATLSDQRFQGPTFYGVADADPRMLPGRTLGATVLVGAPVVGVGVPENAVVFWQGVPWVFVKTGDNDFSRRQIAIDMPASGGSYVTPVLTAATTIVTHGAQLLLSEELKTASSGRETE